jgi:hypothetical protein
MGSINVASFGLAFGAIGQAAFYESLFQRHDRLIFLFLLLPWLTIYTISFCRQPPFSPRTFRCVLMSAMCWYAVATLLAESLHFLLRSAPYGHFSFTAARWFMYLGALSFIVFVRFCIVLRRYGTERGSMDRRFAAAPESEKL